MSVQVKAAVGFSRAVRVGLRVLVAGTLEIEAEALIQSDRGTE